VAGREPKVRPQKFCEAKAFGEDNEANANLPEAQARVATPRIFANAKSKAGNPIPSIPFWRMLLAHFFVAAKKPQ